MFFSKYLENTLACSMNAPVMVALDGETDPLEVCRQGTQV